MPQGVREWAGYLGYVVLGGICLFLGTGMGCYCIWIMHAGPERYFAHADFPADAFPYTLILLTTPLGAMLGLFLGIFILYFFVIDPVIHYLIKRCKP